MLKVISSMQISFNTSNLVRRDITNPFSSQLRSSLFILCSPELLITPLLYGSQNDWKLLAGEKWVSLPYTIWLKRKFWRRGQGVSRRINISVITSFLSLSFLSLSSESMGVAKHTRYKYRSALARSLRWSLIRCPVTSCKSIVMPSR